MDGDLFGVCQRLKSIDDGYRVFRNYKTGKFEVHNVKDSPTLCLVLPYETLDERTVDHVLKTRAERVKALIERAERDNAKLERRIVSAVTDSIANAIGG